MLGDTEVHLLDYVRMLYKRRWTALTVFLVVVCRSPSTRSRRRRFTRRKSRSSSRRKNANVVSFKEAFEQNQIADDYYQTQYKILQSRALARRTLDALKLWNHPAVQPASRRPFAAIRRSSGAGRRWWPGWFKAAPPSRRARRGRDDQPVGTIDRFLDEPDGVAGPQQPARGRQVRLARPALSAKVANAAGEGVHRAEPRVQVHCPRRKRRTGSGERLGEQRKQVETSEQALQRYREKTDSVSLEDKQNIVVQKLTDLNAAVTRAKTERIQKEALYNQIRALQNDRAALDTFPAISQTPSSSSRRATSRTCSGSRRSCPTSWAPSHPEMVKLGLAIQTAEAKLQGEIAKVVQSMRNDYLAVAGAGAEPDERARAAEARRAGAQPQGDRLRRAGSATPPATARSSTA